MVIFQIKYFSIPDIFNWLLALDTCKELGLRFSDLLGFASGAFCSSRWGEPPLSMLPGSDVELESFLRRLRLKRNALLRLRELLLPCLGLPAWLSASVTNELSKPASRCFGEFMGSLIGEDHGSSQPAGLGELLRVSGNSASSDGKSKCFGEELDVVGEFLAKLLALIKQ